MMAMAEKVIEHVGLPTVSRTPAVVDVPGSLQPLRGPLMITGMGPARLDSTDDRTDRLDSLSSLQGATERAQCL
jgi:hypothetical protein